MGTENLYEIKAKNMAQQDIKMDVYKNKVLLIVNVASKCGLTPQYAGLEQLYKELHSRNFEILGFPCNQFGAQEPGTEAEIKQFCDMNYSVTFPMFAKIDVNGPNSHPLYKFLSKKAPDPEGVEAIKWNFTKFLVDKKGQTIKRFSPQTTPDEIRKHIEAIL